MIVVRTIQIFTENVEPALIHQFPGRLLKHCKVKSPFIHRIFQSVDCDRSVAPNPSGLLFDPAAGHSKVKLSDRPLIGIHGILAAGNRLIHNFAAVDHGQPGMGRHFAEVLPETAFLQKLCLVLRKDLVIDQTVERYQDQGVLNRFPLGSCDIAFECRSIVSEKERPAQRIAHPVDRIVFRVFS